MAYKIKFRRRRERKTDYKARLMLLKSFLPRIVIRKTNRYIIVQLVESREAQDIVLCTVNSKGLIKYGWPSSHAGSLKSTPAAYLTGLLFAKRIRENKIQIKKAIVDLGLASATKGSRLFACVKGLADSGINLPHSAEIFPDEPRIYGRHMKKEIPIGEIKEKLLNNQKEKIEK